MRNLALMTLLTLTAAPLTASADTLPDIYLGLVGGYSASVDLPDGVSEPMGVALGARGGLTIPTTDIYVGALFLYHFGDSDELAGLEVSSSSFMLGGEAGYEFGFGPLVLRPSLGIGLNSASVEGALAGVKVDSSTSAVYFSPGAALMVKLGILLGAEVRYNAVADDDIPDSVSILGTLGVAI